MASESSFLSLPLELRNMIYTYAGAIPTPSSPALIHWAYYRDDSPHQYVLPIVSLYLVCKTICNDLPSMNHLLRTGAAIPTIIADLSDTYEQLISKFEIPKGLASAKILRVMGYIQTHHITGQRRRNEAEWWQKWLAGWSVSKWGNEALDVFLKGDGEESVEWQKKIQVQITEDSRGEVFRDPLSYLFMRAHWKGLRNLEGVEVLDEQGKRMTRLETIADWDLDKLKKLYERLQREDGEIGQLHLRYSDGSGIVVERT
ncbi:hypothetical protein MMC10_003223 [Thelotrema lepadinum]|nr:hypothetical protein [Thelotrema lepadinum]